MADAKIKVQKSKIKTTAKTVSVKPVKVSVSSASKPKEKTEKIEKVNLVINVFDKDGKKSGTITLPEEIFGVKSSPKLVAQAVRVYLANQRQGAAHTKTRGEVAYSTRKVWRQKGTGRARHGARKGPIFVGGGITFGPRTRDFSLEMPKTMRRKALFSALSEMLLKENILVINLSGITGKTREVASLLKALSLTDKKGNVQKTLFVTDNDSNTKQAVKNIGGLTVLPANSLHAYSVLKSRKIVFVKDAISLLEKTFLNKEKN